MKKIIFVLEAYGCGQGFTLCLEKDGTCTFFPDGARLPREVRRFIKAHSPAFTRNSDSHDSDFVMSWVDMDAAEIKRCKDAFRSCGVIRLDELDYVRYGKRFA